MFAFWTLQQFSLEPECSRKQDNSWLVVACTEIIICLGMYERSKISSLGAVDWWEICHALLLNYSFAFSNNYLGQTTLILSEASASFPLKSAFEYLVTVAMERRNKRHGEKRGCKMPGCDATTVLTPRQQDGCGLGTRLDCC